MLIILNTEIEPVFNVSTPWGEEKLIYLLEHMYVRTETYKRIEDAIADCQRDLHSGFNSVVVKEKEGASLWCVLPKMVNVDLHKMTTALDKQETIALESASPAKRTKSWLNLVMHLTQNPNDLMAVH
ncbi:hypothetical protein TUMEXPCC7403_20170 [Tumidithrix helvetica PCC 7403]|uniref:hypothetical protein n=1 Tax=Tumidithrix helvetica TaxID=3457545 RepID=UPI003C91D743